MPVIKRVFLSLIFMLSFTGFVQAQVVPTPPDWKEWSTHPKVPTMTADQIQELMFRGEKVILIYAGYRTDKIICGSVHISYTLTPPFNDGSKIHPVFPKDAWLVAYCP